MDDLKRQVRAARRRLQLQQLLNHLPWTLTVTLTCAGLAIAATKIWPLAVRPQLWSVGWLSAAAVVGLVLAMVMTYLSRDDELDAAIEIDQRFGLKERIASSLSLSDSQRETPTGRALVDDAARRAAKFDVAENFPIRPSRWSLVPGLLAVTAFGLTLLTDAQPESLGSAANAKTNVAEQKSVKNSTQQLIKKSSQLQRKAAEKGLEDASKLFKQLEVGVDSLQQKQDVDRQKALVKLNDLAKQVQDRQRELLSREDLRKQLNGLKDIKRGPADKMAQSMKKGDFKAALGELKKLQASMKDGKLNETQKQQMQAQLQQLQQKLQQMVTAHEQAKDDLEKQIQQKLAQGDREAAGKLQNQLDKMQNQQQQMKQFGQLAEKMNQAAQAMKQGDDQQAMAAMSEMAEGLEAMQMEMEEMEMLEDALGQIAGAKDAMNCAACQGMGCAQCQGFGMGGMGGMGMGDGTGDGMGEGQGRGDRPEEESKYGTYDSQVRAKPGKGRAVVTGTALGPNQPGQAVEEIKAAIETARAGKDDPLTGQRLPKPQRELTREYFGAFNE